MDKKKIITKIKHFYHGIVQLFDDFIDWLEKEFNREKIKADLVSSWNILKEWFDHRFPDSGTEQINNSFQNNQQIKYGKILSRKRRIKLNGRNRRGRTFRNRRSYCHWSD
ncbi:MAG: hypothetical protein QW228_01130 [Candidatus Aenigmatarchaeota archaeon]